MRRGIIVFSLLVLMILISRGWLYRSMICYNKSGEREKIEITNQKLVEVIQSEWNGEHLELSGVLKLAARLTSKTLRFSSIQKSQDPNGMLMDGRASCIGYSAFYSAVLEFLLSEQGEAEMYEVNHVKGRLELFGVDIHQFLRSPFFKDHDYNEIMNKETGERILVDASVEDYFYIHRVRGK